MPSTSPGRELRSNRSDARDRFRATAPTARQREHGHQSMVQGSTVRSDAEITQGRSLSSKQTLDSVLKRRVPLM